MANVHDQDIKSEALAMIQSLPDGATWDDIMEAIYVRQKIEAGLRDAEAGRTISNSEVRLQYGLESS
jgi:predicted transcriptional regulator